MTWQPPHPARHIGKPPPCPTKLPAFRNETLAAQSIPIAAGIPHTTWPCPQCRRWHTAPTEENR